MQDVSPYLNQNWPEAVWDVSGAFADDRELVAFYDFCSTVLGVEPFHIVHGAPLCIWNSGRVVKHLLCDAEDVRQAGLAYEARRIALYLTFTNLLLEEQHLTDPLGNAICHFISRHNPTGRNAVIVASDMLSNHIRKEYPQLRQVSSILKITNEGGKGRPEHYLRLAERYDEVMVHPDDVLNLRLLEQLEDKEKYILLVNEYCIRHCPLRPWHYTTLSQISLNYLSHDNSAFEQKQATNGCRQLYTMLHDDKRGVLALNVPEMQELYDMGFRHFKLQGRGHPNAAPLLFDLLRLVLRQDGEDENVMHATALRFWESLVPAG